MKIITLELALVVGVIAASSAAAAGQAQAPPSEPAHKVFVLSGCLADNPAAPVVFKLTDAASVGQAPTDDRADAGDGKKVYELLPAVGLAESGIAKEELQSHVGKRVEVTVRLAEDTAAPSSPASPSTTTTLPKHEEVPALRYTVTKIKALAPSCA